MPSFTQAPPHNALSSSSSLQDILGEKGADSDFYLPTIKVISYSGPGRTGGVPTSLEPIAERLGTNVHWFCIEDAPSDSQITETSTAANSRLDTSWKEKKEAGFKFYSPELSQPLIAGHHRFAHLHLWPLMHSQTSKVEFNHQDWRAYNELCASIASKCQSVAQESYPTLFWLHDFQFAMAAPLVAAERGALVSQFWHVPWPKAEIFASSPVAKEIVDALLHNSVLGFHTAEYAHNFMETVQLLFPTASVDSMNMLIHSGGRSRRKTRIAVMPLGIDVTRWSRLSHQARPMAEVLPVKHRLANQILLGVDRLDYTKGVLEKLDGLEKYLETTPEMHRRFHYVQISQPPQATEAPYLDYAARVSNRIDSINTRYGANGWKPIVEINAHLSQEELAAWYQAADVLSVNSISDGLNLIAKEFVACRQDEQGVLILSEQTGCAKELGQGAILVDPVMPGEFADAIGRALSMGIEEKRRRMTSMRHVIGWNQLHDWALDFLKLAL